jgi:peptidoglycan/LPS O-acetylase OafA/YrhL
VIFVHAVPWATAAQGTDSVSWATQWFARTAGTIFQPHGETNPAVLAFIVLSGYCIQKSWMNHPDVRKFFIRRVFRIIPVFLLGIVVGVLGFAAARSISPLAEALSGTRSIEPACIAAKATVIAALTPAFHPCSYAGNAPLLTVMVEIALYAAFPLLLWGGRRAVLAACAACFAAGLIVTARNPDFFNWWQNSSLYGFLPYWWIGAAFAASRAFRKIRPGWPLCGWALLTAVTLYDTTGVTSEIRKVPFALLIGLLIVRMDYRELAPGTMSAVGRAGYSVYALHAPLVYFLLIAGAPWWLACLFAIGTGIAAFFVIELPLDRLGRAIAARAPNIASA